ncbi:MAG: VWA domain-containing protein [Chlorobiaceae bacterium]
MSFAWPENIGYLLLLIPLAVILGYGVVRHMQVREALVSQRLAETAMPGQAQKLIILKKVLLFLGIGLLLFAMTGPRFLSGGRPVLRKGADIVFLLDVSRSMRAADVSPDRLWQAKYEITRISQAVTGGRRAIVIFAGEPLAECPLTTDSDAFAALLNMASPELIEAQGTVFRSALNLAETVLDPAAERGMKRGGRGEKIIVMLSDGEDHAGNLAAIARSLKSSGIHLFVAGVGMAQPVPIPLANGAVTFKRDESGKAVTTSFHPETLQELARQSGGSYFRSRADQPVFPEISARINRIAAASRWMMEPVEREPLYYYSIGAAIGFLLMETMIGRGWRSGR